MIGAIINKIDGGSVNSDIMIFHARNGKKFTFYHRQDCCESVTIDDICGDINDLLNSPIIEAEEVSNADAPVLTSPSYTWTFYRFATVKGSVTVKWLGMSNGYYSEGVSFDEDQEEIVDEDHAQPVKDKSEMTTPIAITDFETQWKRICKKVKALDMGYNISLNYNVEKSKWFMQAAAGTVIYTANDVTILLNNYEKLLDNLVLDKKNKLEEELKKFNF